MYLIGFVYLIILLIAVNSCDPKKIGSIHIEEGWHWSDGSEVKCRPAPEFSPHAEICIERN